MPGRTKIGTWRASGRRTYVCLRGSGPAVRLEVSGEDGAARGYQAYLVSCVDPDEVAAAVARRSTSG